MNRTLVLGLAILKEGMTFFFPDCFRIPCLSRNVAGNTGHVSFQPQDLYDKTANISGKPEKEIKKFP